MYIIYGRLNFVTANYLRFRTIIGFLDEIRALR